jgi:uncharacterized protein YegL
MPKLMTDGNEEIISIPGGGNFQFSAVRIEDLDGATEYTLVTVVVDVSGSVIGFSGALLDCIKTIFESCQKSPRSENLLVRLITFNRNLEEIHGFLNLSDIDINTYPDFHCAGLTALFDGAYDAIGATLEYAKRLDAQDFDSNGAVYIITDGDDNASTMTPQSIKDKVKQALHSEEIESLITVLIGLHDPNAPWGSEIEQKLNEFKDQAGINQFIKVGDATPQNLAKLAGFVSQSISSQSQALGTGAPSQALDF